VTLREQAMALMVRNKLAEDTRTCGQPIDVYVADGDIYLVGAVDTEPQRAVAAELVRGLSGVRRVVDNIRVRQPRPVPA